MADDHLRVLDTDSDRVLTTEDIAELKRLAQMSRAARWLAVSLVGLGGLAVGALELLDKLKHH